MLSFYHERHAIKGLQYKHTGMKLEKTYTQKKFYKIFCHSCSKALLRQLTTLHITKQNYNQVRFVTRTFYFVGK